MSKNKEIIIDGSFGEGGGQILRSSLALSLVTGKAFRIENIRSGRAKPGLMRQHLTCVHAAAGIGSAVVKGDGIGSQELYFEPAAITTGSYQFSVGTAGSTMLVLQTILPALLVGGGRSQVVLEGGTHNPFAPPFDFIEKAFVPIIRRMGAVVEVELERAGFYPAGGGRCVVTVEPVEKLNSIELIERGDIRSRSATAMISKLPLVICEKELSLVRSALGWDRSCTNVKDVKDSHGPGNIVTIEIACENITELFTGFGRREACAEFVAGEAIEPAKRYLASEAAVGEHLADQLILPMAMAGGGRFTTLKLSRHATTNIEIVKKFLDVDVRITKLNKDVYEVDIKQS